MDKILHEDELKCGAYITTSRFATAAVLQVLTRPNDGVVDLREVSTGRVIRTTLWGMGLRSWRIGAGSAKTETFLVATA